MEIKKLLLFFTLPFAVCFFSIELLVFLMKKHRKFQPIRMDGPETHQKKAKTPTMAGVAVTMAIALNILLFCDLNSPHMAVALFLLMVFSTIGLVDDIIKVFCNSANGFRGSYKLILQLFLTAIGIIYLCYRDTNYLDTGITLPVFNAKVPLGVLTPAFYVLILCGSSNAANFTDGLDGLLAIPVIMISTTLMAITILMSNGCSYSNVLPSEKVLHDIIIVMISVIAAFSGFFIYNKHPAKIFMGDVGSLMIGVLLCYTAILLKVEILYALMALLFVVEILSTTAQVTYFKVTGGKRLLKMAPFHHHLEKIGWSEKRIVMFLWLLSFLCCVVAFTLFYYSLQCRWRVV
ncbi:MAG: phospho-N-acetylmuramoyl-pentapeptide-transferase [Rickettsiales bacterium]|nr:phospho-N-acetylmuramoyl-pentapeptide-transferase [Rickettsiales bacterium]